MRGRRAERPFRTIIDGGRVGSGRVGSLILTRSMASLRAYQRIVVYSAAEHGLIGVTKTMAA